MAQQQPMHDPSDGIDPELLRHIHLVSANQYPHQAQIDFNQVTKWLLAAPQIAKDKAPFFWTYLDRPSEGHILLTWQPLKRLGTHFASDGIIWAPEQYFRSDVGNGLMLEIYYNKSGFAPGDQVGARTRRRFRLVPSQSGNINTPQPDISLWIVHYGRAEAQDCLPINMIPFLPETQTMMTQRNFLQSCGQITRKDFMLSDRGNWPQISFPQPGGRGAAAGQPKRIPAQMAYPAQNAVTQTMKRPRGGQPQAQAHAHAQVGPLPDALEEEQRDVFDVLTPRDIAYARYRQNHSWMEELLSSPYPISHIVPSDLGLGLKGELRSVTEGIFDAPGANAMSQIPDKPYVGHLDPGLAAEFRKRTEKHISSTKAEIEKLKADHAKAMQKFKAGSLLLNADRDLRNAVDEQGPELWRLEGRTSDAKDQSEGSWSQSHNKKVDEIVAQVEAHVGRRIAVLHEVNRIQDGGFQEPAPEMAKGPSPPQIQAGTPVVGAGPSGSNDGTSRRPSQAGSQHSGVMVGDADIDMGGTAAGLLDQMHASLSNTSTPLNSFPTPQANLSAMNSNAATPMNADAQSPAPVSSAAEGEPDSNDNNTRDVTMGNTETEMNKEVPPNNPNQGSGGEEWVMVPKGGISPEGAGVTTGDGAGTQAPKPSTPAATGGGPATGQASAVGTPAVTEGDANDFSSLGDLDTAGDALASYEPPALDGAAGSLGEGLDLNMDMEGSAFGDAFHGVGGTNTNTPGENQSEGV
ncbi:DUF1750-domain-containing protein [Sodiomyces alkalinus F11]|uniref:DUF1750-domain-containing protein n=1 Tax=Sodiomyces alkalinus (strain CBS 110278 / VKM F-3762 / F11) TaxID=1314773 RepID=A0A3N2PSC3_SODAK|nr:DUF1750-domain-containing protein [Sodiomyces alkalinus F11]ROT37412.1 DUF1750-domain-containing protein [Sodiomyces alkalinus F11]